MRRIKFSFLAEAQLHGNRDHPERRALQTLNRSRVREASAGIIRNAFRAMSDVEGLHERARVDAKAATAIALFYGAGALP